MSTTQPEAPRLADALASNYFDGRQGREVWDSAAAELRRQHARIAELEAQLSSSGFTTADMATAAAQGFRDGVASVAAGAGSEPVAGMNEYGVRGYLAATLKCWHRLTGDEAAELVAMTQRLSGLYTNPSPPEGMAGGWISVEERLPEPDAPVLAHNGKWTGVAAWMSGDYLEPLERWQDEHREFIEMMGPSVTHWMPMPPAPSSAKGGGTWVTSTASAHASTRLRAARAPADPQLLKFYGVTTDAELIAAQARHIERLQAKLPQTQSFAPQRVREG